MNTNLVQNCPICGGEIYRLPADKLPRDVYRIMCRKCEVTNLLERAGFKNPLVDEEYGWAMVRFEGLWKHCTISEMRERSRKEFNRRWEWRDGEFRRKET